MTVLNHTDIQRRFGLRSRRAATMLMRKMRHVQDGRSCWTTEEWVVEWLAAKALPSCEKPNPINYDPLESAVVDRAVAVVGSLASRGVIALSPSLAQSH